MRPRVASLILSQKEFYYVESACFATAVADLEAF